MQKALFAVFATAFSFVLLSGGVAYSGSNGSPVVLGDPPYTLDWGYDPAVRSGCLRWNWQQYGWDDYCPVYVHPKAYMYPRFSRPVLRTKG